MHLPQHIMDLHYCTHTKHSLLQLQRSSGFKTAPVKYADLCRRRHSTVDTHKLNIIKETILNIILHKSNGTSLEKLKLNNPFNAQKILYVCAVLLDRTVGTMRKLVQSTINFVSHISAIWVLGFSVGFNFLG
jgi:hypothetical protein